MKKLTNTLILTLALSMFAVAFGNSANQTSATEPTVLVADSEGHGGGKKLDSEGHGGGKGPHKLNNRTELNAA